MKLPIIRNLEDETKRNIPIIALTAAVTGLIVESSSSWYKISICLKPRARGITMLKFNLVGKRRQCLIDFI
jgi:hypothetical protein